MDDGAGMYLCDVTPIEYDPATENLIFDIDNLTILN